VARLRCVFYDPDAVDADSRLTARALEACERAGVEVREGGEDAREVMRARGLAPEECIAVGAALADAPVGAVWVGPSDLEVRGANVRVAEEDEELLYDAVIAELAARRSGQ